MKPLFVFGYLIFTPSFSNNMHLIRVQQSVFSWHGIRCKNFLRWQITMGFIHVLHPTTHFHILSLLDKNISVIRKLICHHLIASCLHGFVYMYVLCLLCFQVMHLQSLTGIHVFFSDSSFYTNTGFAYL